MIKALFTAASGMRAQQVCIDTIANNLANVNTNGFKGSNVNFEDLLYEQVLPPGTEVAEGYQIPTGIEIGSGVRIVGTAKRFSQGSVEQTRRDLDMCIQGRGFFSVSMPDGTSAYTRDGSVGMDGSRRLVTAQGRPLSDGVTIPSDTTSITIAADGKVYVQQAGSTEQSLVGQIQLASFANAGGLRSLGGNLFGESVASGAPTLHVPGQEGVGELKQGYLERSNVDVVAELVRLIAAQRAYEINTKAITISDRMLSTSNSLVR